MATAIDVRAPQGKAPFWRTVFGEWFRPRGLTDGEPIDSPAPVQLREDAQAIKPYEDYNRYLPMMRQLGGLREVWIEVIDRMPTTTYPLLRPLVERSGLQPFSIIRTKFQTDTGSDTPTGQSRAYPRAKDANTRVDMRWRVGTVSYGAGGGTGNTPGGARQAGLAIQRRALRVPRYSTIARLEEPTQAATNGGG